MDALDELIQTHRDQVLGAYDKGFAAALTVIDTGLTTMRLVADDTLTVRQVRQLIDAAARGNLQGART